jgi:hypothetical protein
MDVLLAMAVPAVQIAGLVTLGLIFRVDRKPKRKGGKQC